MDNLVTPSAEGEPDVAKGMKSEHVSSDVISSDSEVSLEDKPDYSKERPD